MTAQELFNKALYNRAFWNELRKDPAKALKDAGIQATPEQVKTLRQLNFDSLEAVATAFGSGASDFT